MSPLSTEAGRDVMPERSVILASQSLARRDMLKNAGVSFFTEVAGVDEDAVRRSMLAEQAPVRDIVDILAEIKALRVSAAYPGQLVIGSDQILVLDGNILSKPKTRDEAAGQLTQLSGQTHQLLSAAVIAENEAAIWRHIGAAQLTMRPLSESFIEDYLHMIGDDVLFGAGTYQIEGRGAQLFERIHGDYFSILGMPLLQVLDYLRQRGVLDE